MYFDFFTVAVLLVVGLLFVYANIAIFSLLRPSKPTAMKLSTYECGEEAIGTSWIRFDMRFYTVALIFVVFDVEVALLFPWAVVFRDLGMAALVPGVLFILILVLGLAYEWAKGDLDWIKAFTPGTAGPHQAEAGARSA